MPKQVWESVTESDLLHVRNLFHNILTQNQSFPFGGIIILDITSIYCAKLWLPITSTHQIVCSLEQQNNYFKCAVLRLGSVNDRPVPLSPHNCPPSMKDPILEQFLHKWGAQIISFLYKIFSFLRAPFVVSIFLKSTCCNICIKINLLHKYYWVFTECQTLL